MAGDVQNTAVWGEADVLIAPIAAVIPAGNAAFSDAWEYVGLLSGSDGFTESVEVSQTDHDAWGYGVVATTYKGQKTTKTFTTFEDNETVLGLVYDVSAVTFGANTYTGTLGVKDFTDQVRIAFVVRSGDQEKRLISANYATIAATNAGTESEDSLQSRQFTATVYPTSDKGLWVAFNGASL